MGVQPQGVPGLAGTTIGQYRVLELVGRGGMGEVYRAEDQRLHRYVAIKALPPSLASDPQRRRGFVREARLASKIVHPYVATVFDVIERGEDLFLVMEYLEGRTLRQVLHEQRPDLRTVAAVGLEVGEALEAIHRAGLVHRDLKPSNIMVTAGRHVKVMDFGVARASPSGFAFGVPSTETLTVGSIGGGTPQYMSPEQLRGQDVDERSDLFSLGGILYEAIAGVHPFQRPSLGETISAILSEPPGGGSEPRTLTESGPLRQIVLRLLEKERHRRYGSAAGLVADLRPIVQGVDPVEVRQARTTRRGRVALAAVLASALTALGVWFAVRPSSGSGSAAARRPLVAVLPFVDRSDEDGSNLRGEMLASLLAGSLSESGNVRSLGSDRLADVLSGVPADATRSRHIDAVRGAADVQLVLAGSLFREAGRYAAVIDVYGTSGESPERSIEVQAPDALALARRANGRLQEVLWGARATDEQTRGSRERPSDEILLLIAEAKRAIREYRLSDAVQELQRASQKDPQSLEAFALLTEAYQRAGFDKAARRAAARAVDLARAPHPAVGQRLRWKVRALAAAVSGDHQRHLDVLAQMARSYADEPEHHESLASTLIARGQWEKAAPALQRALQLDPENARLWLLHSRLLVGMSRFDDARGALDRAHALSRGLGSALLLGMVEEERGRLQWAQGDHAAALASYGAARAQFQRAGNPVAVARAESNAAYARLVSGELALGRDTYERSIRVARTYGNHRRVVEDLNTLGAHLFLQGELDDAEHHLRSAVQEARRLENAQLLIDPLINLASLLATKGDAGESGALAGEAAELSRSISDPTGEVKARILLGNSSFVLGRLRAAADVYREAAALAQRHGDPESAVWALLYAVESQEALGRLGEARASLDRAAGLLAGLDQRWPSVYTHLWRAHVLALLGFWDDAAHALRELERLAGPAEQRPFDLGTRVQLVRGRLEMLQGRWGPAAMWLAKVRGLPEAEILSLISRSTCARRLGEASRATDLARDALGHSQARATDRLSAAVELARALASQGRHADAAASARQAFDMARNLDVPLAQAHAAALLLSLPPPHAPDELEGVRAAGESALRCYLEGAPAEARASIARRKDLEEVFSVLGPGRS